MLQRCLRGDFKGCWRKTLPIFVSGAAHALQVSFERQTAHSSPAPSGYRLGGAAANNAGRSASLFEPCHRNRADFASGVSMALRQSEGLIGSIMRMLEIDLPVPDHTTLSRRACGLPVQLPWRNKTSDLHLIVDSTGLDSTGLKLRGAGEWLFEKHGTAKRRAWRKLHIGIDADSREIVAFDLSRQGCRRRLPRTHTIGSTDAGSRFLHGRWRIRQDRDI